MPSRARPSRESGSPAWLRFLWLALTALALTAIAVMAFELLPSAPAPGAGRAYQAPESLPHPTEAQLHPGAEEQQLQRNHDALLSEAQCWSKDSANKQSGPLSVTIDGRNRKALVLRGGTDGEEPERRYKLMQVAAQWPDFAELTERGVLIRNTIIVCDGARLRAHSKVAAAVLLRSDATGFATIAAVGGSLTFTGTPHKPLTITTFDRRTGGPDLTQQDGRGFVIERGGRMTLTDTVAADLGFFTGASSGIAWMADLPRERPALGSAIRAKFLRNYFGAYSSGAHALVLDRAEFRDNTIYGFDPHSGTNDSVVSNSIATGNGTHGIIFSKGCHRNVIRDTESSGNGRSGFVIDDGNPDLGPIEGSDLNQLANLRADGNGDAGIIIEGGVGNRISSVSAHANRYGIWAKNGAIQTTVSDAAVTATAHSGIRLDPGTDADVQSVLVQDATTGVALSDAQASLHAVTIEGVATGIRLTGAVNASYSDVTITGSGATAMTGGLASGVTLGLWELPEPSSLRARLAAKALHPLEMVIWSLILLPPALALLSSRRRAARRRSPVNGSHCS